MKLFAGKTIMDTYNIERGSTLLSGFVYHSLTRKVDAARDPFQLRTRPVAQSVALLAQIAETRQASLHLAWSGGRRKTVERRKRDTKS